MKTVIEMAREAGFDPHDMSADFTCNLKDIERFAELVRADAIAEEREACATLCENLEMHPDQGDCWDIGTLDCADSIRARSNT